MGPEVWFGRINGGGASTQWTTNGSNISYSAGQVGIGTTSPNGLGAGGAPTILQVHNAGTGLYTPGSIVLSSNTTTNWGYVGTIMFGSGGLTGSSKKRMAQIQVNKFNSDPTDPAATMSFLTANGPGTDPAIRMTIDNIGNVGIGTMTPTAGLQLKPGAAEARSAPLKFTSGTLMTAPENGAVEFDGNHLYLTSGGIRRTLAGGSTSGTLDSITNINNSNGGITLAPGVSNSVLINGSAASTSPATGTLIVSGGAGVEGNLNVGGAISSGDTISASTAMWSPSIFGSNAASGTLTLDSTSNATKGSILLAPEGGSVGIGTATPQSRLMISDGSNIVPTYNPSYGKFLHVDGTLADATSGRHYPGSTLQINVAPAGAPGTGLYLGQNLEMKVPASVTADLSGRALIGQRVSVMPSNSGAAYGQMSGSTTQSWVMASDSTVSLARGLYAMAANQGSNTTITDLIPVDTFSRVYSASTVTNLYSFRSKVLNDGVVGTAYGVYIAAPTGSGTTSNKYALVTEANSGNVGIGTISPLYKLDVDGDISTSSCFRIGATTIGGICTSDARLKENIQDYRAGLDELLNLRLRTYQFNGLGEMPKNGEVAVGVIAQELEQTNPELIKTRKIKMHPKDIEYTEIKAVDYSQFTYMLINAVKELYRTIVGINADQITQDRNIASKADHIEVEVLRAEIAQLKASGALLRERAEEAVKRAENKSKEIELLKQQNAEMKARLSRIEKILLSN